MSVFSNNRFLKRVNPEIVRAKDDSGSSLNHPEIQKLMRQMVDLGIADNLKLWVHSGLVKTRTSGSDLYVPKAYDISGEENDAVQATEANQPKLVSTGMEFDGINDLLDAGNDTSVRITNNISAFVWCKPTTGSGDKMLFGRWLSTDNNRVWVIDINNNAFIVIISRTGQNVGYRKSYRDLKNAVDDGNWWHVGFTFASNVLKLYTNGEEITGSDLAKTEDQTVNTLYVTDTKLVLCAMQNPGLWYGGVADDFRLYNKVLSASKIEAIYNATKSKYGHT